jgi:hypothetical protein
VAERDPNACHFCGGYACAYLVGGDCSRFNYETGKLYAEERAMKERTIKLPIEGITITLCERGGRTAGAVTSDLTPDTDLDSDEYDANDGRVDALYSMLLAHACAGIDVETPAYLTGVQAVVDAIVNDDS